MTIAPSTAFLRPDLGMAYEGFDLEAERMGFIAMKVLPVFMAGQNAAQFTVLPIEESLKDANLMRSPGSHYQRDDFKPGQDNYSCKERGKEAALGDDERAIYRYAFDAEQVVADRALNSVLRDLERSVAAKVFNTTTWTGASLTTAVSTKWTTASTATPISDIHAAIKKVRASCGQQPNVVVMSYNTFLSCQTAAQVVNRLVLNAREESRVIDTRQLAMLFQVEEVIVGNAMRNTANEGASLSISSIWSDEMVMVARVARTADLSQSCIGRLFHFAGDGNGSVIIDQYREEQTRSDVFRARTNYDDVIIDARCGHLLTNIA